MLILPLSTPSSGGLPPGVTSPGDGALNYVTGALTASRPSINVEQTWNGPGVVFAAIKVNVTNNQSAAASTLLDLQNGAARFRVFRDASFLSSLGFGTNGSGHIFSSDGSRTAYLAPPGFFLPSTAGVWWSETADGTGTTRATLFSPSAGVVNQRNGAAAQTYRLERTYTDPSSRGYTDFAQDATGGLGINSVWTGGVAAPTNLLSLQANGARRVEARLDGAFQSVHSLAIGPFAGNLSFYAGILGGGKEGLALNSTAYFGWSSGAQAASGIQIGFARATSDSVEINNGTAGMFRDLRLRNVITPGGTAASLVAAATAGQGAHSFVTDATASTFGAIVAGGGSNKVPVWSDGANWLIG